MNEMKLSFLSKAENEPFARTALIAFLMPLNPNVEEIMELKTMIAEALTNAMIHGYEGREDGIVEVSVRYDAQAMVEIIVKDCGCGIADVALAMQPLYTSKAYLERSGMGMTIMSTFADEFHVTSTPGKGTAISIKKILHDTHEDSR